MNYRMKNRGGIFLAHRSYAIAQTPEIQQHQILYLLLLPIVNLFVNCIVVYENYLEFQREAEVTTKVH